MILSPRTARRAVLAVGVIAVSSIWIRLAVRPSTDLLNHQEFGRRFVAGTPLYEGGLNYPYLPAWALAHAPLAPVSPDWLSALILPIGVAALVLLLWTLDRVSRASLPLAGDGAFWVAAATIALTSRFVIRDLLDGGANLVLTSLAWGALLLWQQRRSWPGAVLLGTAIALKLTAGIFLVALAAARSPGWWLRTIVATAAIVLLPAAWMGTERYNEHVGAWWTRVSAGVASGDPAIGVLGVERADNLALRPAVGRWFAGPAAAVESRAQVAAAGFVAAGTIIAALAVWAWRRRAPQAPDAVVWAAAGIVALLASPITWRAHLVAILPACYLLIRRWMCDGYLHPTGRAGLIAVAVPGILLARGTVGSTVSQWSDQWAITTLALLVLLLGIATWPSRR